MTAANGGIWKSADGGKTLIPIADHLPTLAMGAIAIDPANLFTYRGTAHIDCVACASRGSSPEKIR